MSEELKREVIAKILQYLSVEKLETNKFEFKRQWYDLRVEAEKHEFFKDSTAIVNSYGGDDAFIVFGVDEKTKELFDTNIEDSGYKDQSSIRDIIDSNIDKPFRFDVDHVEVKDKKLSVMHLHPSTDKPHVILRYQDKKTRIFENEIFLRSGSSKVVASKGDLDRMYIERNSIIVERKAEVSINFHRWKSHVESSDDGGQRKVTIERPFFVENKGNRLLVIYKIYLKFHVPAQIITFIHKTKSEAPIVVPVNSFMRDNLTFEFYDFSPTVTVRDELGKLVNEVLGNPTHSNVQCTLQLANGELLPTTLFMPNINHEVDNPATSFGGTY